MTRPSNAECVRLTEPHIPEHARSFVNRDVIVNIALCRAHTLPQCERDTRCQNGLVGLKHDTVRGTSEILVIKMNLVLVQNPSVTHNANANANLLK